MKTRTTKANGQGLQSHPEVVKAHEGEFAKYIVLLLDGREQVTVFPFQTRHVEVFDYVKTECPTAKAIAAGFFLREGESAYCFGHSESLDLSSRPEDRKALEAFFASTDRQLWDLTRLSAEAQASARQEMAEAGWCSRTL